MPLHPARKYTLFFFFIPAMMLIAPVIFSNPFQYVLGNEYSDSFKHVWSFWHTPQNMFSWPYTEYLNAPRGGFFYDLMFLPALVMSPISLIFGPVFTANCWIVLSLMAIGYCTFLLCEYMECNFESSIVGGWMALSSPYLLGYPITGGVYERLGIWVFPFLILCTLKYLEEKTTKWMLMGISSYIFVVFGCPIYGIYMGIILLLLLPYLYKKQSQHSAMRQLFSMYSSLVVSSLLIYFIILQLNDTGSIAPQIHRLNPTMGVVFVPESSTIFGLFHPFYTKQLEVLGDTIPTIHYVGWTILIPLLITIFTYRKYDRLLLFLTGISILFLVLSLGPTIRVQNIYSSQINPVFYLFSYIVPYLGNIPTSWQMTSVVGTFASVVVAVWLSKIPNGKRNTVAIILLLFCATERRIAIRNLDFRPIAIKPDISFDAIQDKNGSVMEIPRVYLDLQLSRDQIFINQMFHERPTSIAINLGTTQWDLYKPVLGGRSSNWGKVRSCLLRGGFRYVLIHKDLLLEDELKKLKTIGSTIVENEHSLLLDIEPDADWTVPISQTGPIATRHHAEIVIGEFGISLDSNDYITETCPVPLPK
jgi:hypothetical protein